MTRNEIVAEMLSKIPARADSHVMWWMMDLLAKGKILPFHDGLITSLEKIERAAQGYASMQISRIAQIPTPIDDKAREALYQILGEIYCTDGAVDIADEVSGKALIEIEPGEGGKNPEFESFYEGIRYAVEVKTPALIKHRRERMKNDLQITTRLPREVFKDKEKTLPRDNPVKDFLLSANEKFKAHKALRPDTYGILTIVWDDFSHEAVAALVSPVSGLLTSNSFFRNSVGETITFPNVDGIVICRYQHWIAHTFGNVPLDDPAYGRTRFLQYRVSEPPKAFVQNPSGRDVPEPLLKALDALPLSECQGAEYSPIEMIFWT